MFTFLLVLHPPAANLVLSVNNQKTEPDMAGMVSNQQSNQHGAAPVESHASDDAGAEKAGEQVPTDFPEGGAAAWAVAIGTSAVTFCTLGYVNSFGVYQTWYQDHQLKTTSPSTIAWIGSLQAFFLFSGTLFGGPLFDRYGATVIRIPALLYVFSVMMTSICTKLWHFILAQGVLGGLSLGMTMAPAMAAVGQYFHKKRGLAIGLGVAGSSLGGVILPIALDKLLHQPSLSFGWSVRIIGFIILALLAPSCLFIKARLPPRRTSFFLPRAFKEPPYFTLVACCFFLMMGLFPPMFYLPSYAITQGMGSDLAFYLVAILNSTSFPGRIIPGLLADRFGRLNMLFFAGLSTGILSLCWQACHSNAGILVYTTLFGFCSGAIISGQVVALTTVSHDPRSIGTYLGMGMGVAAFATLVGPPASGAIVSNHHSYTGVSILSGVASLVGAVLVIPAKLTAGHKVLSRN